MNTWAEVMKAIGALEDRVEELEARIPAPEIRTMKAPSPTHDGRIVVSANEYSRLTRLDYEVRAFLSWLEYPESGLVDRNSSILEGMREALGR